MVLHKKLFESPIIRQRLFVSWLPSVLKSWSPLSTTWWTLTLILISQLTPTIYVTIGGTIHIHEWWGFAYRFGILWPDAYSCVYFNTLSRFSVVWTSMCLDSRFRKENQTSGREVYRLSPHHFIFRNQRVQVSARFTTRNRLSGRCSAVIIRKRTRGLISKVQRVVMEIACGPLRNTYCFMGKFPKVRTGCTINWCQCRFRTLWISPNHFWLCQWSQLFMRTKIPELWAYVFGLTN